MMRTRTGFARMLPLMALTGLAAGTIVLLASARPVQAPVRAPELAARVLCGGGDKWCAGRDDSCCGGDDFRNAAWAAVDLHSDTFVQCDFRFADLRGADFRGCRLYACNFTAANLTEVDLTGATFDRLTRWPAGFNPQAHGARVEK
jgi:hypothetical protein